MSIYIVPPDGGKGGAPSKPRGRRRASSCLTPTENAALRTALKNLNQKHTWQEIAEMLGVCRDTVRFVGNGRGSAGLALSSAKKMEAFGRHPERVV